MEGPRKYDLGTRISTEKLREAYAGYCKQQGLRAGNEDTFDKACAEMFGPRKRLARLSGIKSRPWGYDVPDGDTWQQKVDARLGIRP